MRHIIGLLLFSLVGNPLFSQVIAWEKFDYLTNENMVGQGTNQNGWAAAWQLLSGTEPGFISNDSIVNLTLQRRSSLPIAILPSGQDHILERKFAEKIMLTDTLWFSFLSQTEINNINTKGTLALVDYTYDNLLARRIEFGKTFASNQIVNDGALLYPRSSGKSYIKGQWTVVMLIPDGPNTVLSHTWINPDFQSQPDTLSAQIQNRTFEISGVDAIQLIAMDQNGLNWKVDDIYFGRSFQDIVPADWVEVMVDSEVVNAKETFDYPVGEGLNEKSGGSGFIGGWKMLRDYDHSIADLHIQFADGELSQSPLLLFTHQQEDTGNRYIRRLESPYPDDGNTYWLGAVMDIDWTNNANVAQFFLGNINELNASGPAGQKLLLGKSFNEANFALGVGGNYSYTEDIPAAGAYFVVVRIITSGDNAPEQIDLWINPDPSLVVPPLSEIQITKMISLNDGWNAIGFKAEGQAGINLKIDDLAIGKNFTDVIPDYLIAFIENVNTANPFQISPNPGNGVIKFDSQQLSAIEYVQVYNLAGQSVNHFPKEKIDGQSLQVVDIHAAAGAYLLIIHTDNTAHHLIYIKQ